MRERANRVKAAKDGKQHVIIGNCIAAVSAADMLRTLNSDDRIVIIGEEAVPSYSRCLITYFLGDTVTKEHLLSHTGKWYTERAIDLKLSTKAEEVDVKRHIVHVRTKGSRKKVSYDTLLVASGASPIFLPAFPYDVGGIIGMRSYDDSRKLKAWAKQGRKGIIIGGGFVGLKTAYGLVKQGVRVKVVELLPTLLGKMADPEASARVRDRLTSNALVEIKLNTSVSATRKRGNRYLVTYDNGEEEEADFIVASVGVRANTDFLEGSGVAIDGVVQVDERQRTTVADVYAAGDVCRSRHIVTKEWIHNALWPVAAAQGRAAAYNMSGQDRTYEGNIPMNSLDFYELWITALGNVQEEGDDIEDITFKSSGIYQKVKLREGIPISFIGVGNVDGAGLVRAAIIGKIAWQEFIKRPHSQILPVVNQCRNSTSYWK